MTEDCIKDCKHIVKENGYYYCTEGEYKICLSVTIGKTLRHGNCKQPKDILVLRKVKETNVKSCETCKHCDDGICYRFPPQPAIMDCGIYGHPSYMTVWKYPEVGDRICGEYKENYAVLHS